MTVVHAGHTLFAHGTLQADQSFTVDAGNAYTPGGVVIIEGAVESYGFVTIAGSASSAPASAAHVTIDKAGVLTNYGDIIIGFGGGLSNDGVGPTIDIAGALVNDNQLRFGQGYAGIPGTMTIEATGTLQNNYSFSLAGGAPTAGFSGFEPGATLVDIGVLTNSGTLQFFGGATGTTYSGHGAYLDVIGQLTNTGLIHMMGAYGGLRGGSYDGGTSGTLNVAGRLTNSGTIQIDAANSYGYGVGISGSTLSLLQYARLENQGTITVGGGGKGSNGLAPAGLLAVGNGFLGDAGVITVDGGNGGLGGTLSASVYGAVYVDGTLIAAGGTDGGGGGSIAVDDLSVAIGGLLHLEAGTPGSGGGVLVATEGFSDDGTIVIDGGPGVSTASLTIDAGATSFDDGTVSGSGQLVNNGDFATAGAQISVAEFYNGGTVFAETGHSLDITSGVLTNAGHTGTFNIGASGTLGLFGSVAAGQTVRFDTYFTPATLALGDAAAFNGTLDRIGALAIIDFLKLDVTAASSHADTLSVTTTTEGVLSLAITYPLLSGVGFILSSDHAGGTDLTFT